MKKGYLFMIGKDFWRGVKKHQPEILTGLGITGMITTTIMAVKVTPKAMVLIKEKKEELKKQELKSKEILETTWKCYIPAAIVGATSIACLIGASTTNQRRNAALATAYTLSESTFKEYQERIVESIGEKKEKEIRDDISKDKILQNPVTQINQVILTEKGTTLCYDSLSGRYFKSDIEYIKKIVNDLNKRMRDESWISLNDFYYELGLDSIKIGDDLGWNIDRGYIDIHFASHLDIYDTPCLVLDYAVAPTYDFM